MYQYILYELKNGVATITLNRPETLNSFNWDMAQEVEKAFRVAENDPAVRAVILTGEGRGFCAGQDLKEVLPSEENPNPREIGDIVRGQYNPIVLAIREIPKPVIACVNGVAAGAGANIAFACDFVFAVPTASFIQSFVKIGLIPDSAGTWFLPRIVGMAKATELMMLGDKISAQQALELKLIYKVSETAGYDVYTFAEQLATQPTKSLGYIKQLINMSFDHTLEEQLMQEEIYQSKAGKTKDYEEGVQAFLEKRKANYTGE